MEELLLGPLLAPQKLDVVHEQGVFVPVFVPEIGHLLITQTVDQLVGEFFGRDVTDVRGMVILSDPASRSR